MFWQSKTKAKLKQLQHDNYSLHIENRRLEEKIKDIEIANNASACSFSIDFNTINCWSIERQQYGYTGKTILGYNLYTDEPCEKVREWVLYCNEEQHEKLVAEFNETKKERNAII